MPERKNFHYKTGSNLLDSQVLKFTNQTAGSLSMGSKTVAAGDSLYMTLTEMTNDANFANDMLAKFAAGDIVMCNEKNNDFTLADAKLITGKNVNIEFDTIIPINNTSGTTTCDNRDVLVMNAGNIQPSTAAMPCCQHILGIASAAYSGASSVEVFSIQGTRIDGFTGLTPSTLYFSDPANPGKLTATPPSATGDVIVQIGFALSATEISYSPQFRAIA